MSLNPLEQAAKEASGRIIGALAARFRSLDIAEDAFSDACVKALEAWPKHGPPFDPAGWLYRTAERKALDAIRRQRTRDRLAPEAADSEPQPSPEAAMIDDAKLIPDERLRLIFVCCHPAVAPESRVALTLRLVCGLSVSEIAHAFLVPESTLAQRLVRAKRKIAEAGIPFEVPGPDHWPDRLEAVLSTIEIAYSKSYEDSAGAGSHAAYASEVLELTRALAEIMPSEAEALALAALVRYCEARRPARLDQQGCMVPLSQQEPGLWLRPLIDQADLFLKRALRLGVTGPRILQASIHAQWCWRKSVHDPPPWPQVLNLYDALLAQRDDVVIRLNRAVALAEVVGLDAAISELATLDAPALEQFLPYQALRADLFRRTGQLTAALAAYDAALALTPAPAERMWLERRKRELHHKI